MISLIVLHTILDLLIIELNSEDLFFRTSRSEDLCKIHIQTDSLLRLIHFPVQHVSYVCLVRTLLFEFIYIPSSTQIFLFSSPSRDITRKRVMSGRPCAKTFSFFHPPLISGLVLLPTCWNYRRLRCMTTIGIHVSIYPKRDDVRPGVPHLCGVLALEFSAPCGHTITQSLPHTPNPPYLS